ncbi:growth hormone secretagogue receptor type 1-like [Elysia marginata]|uniref:Growth hormone secretagogue receptor type 1-like n=1 Tax=Elysia marginata TaxID=1093978 RepID=A0AAV4IQS5_9GAST|nr:growth hormone secretagogue receptor type 1-like [Elysia marginata]
MPTRVSALCTKRRAYFIILAIVVFQCCLHIHFLLFMNIKRTGVVPTASSDNMSSYVGATDKDVIGESGNSGEMTTVLTTSSAPYGSEVSYHCDGGTEDYVHYIHHIWPVLDVFLLSIIPSVLVLMGNLIIVWKVKVSLWTAEELNVTSNSRARRNRFSTMTVMLGLISALFILTTLPTCLYNLWERSDQAKAMQRTPEGSAKIEMIWAFVNLAMYCNNTFNFYLYLLSGRKFRKAVSRQFSRRRTESQSNAISGYSFQLQTRFNQPPQEVRNGHSHGLKSHGGSVHRTFQQTNYQTGKQSSVKYKPCNMSSQSNAYL